MATFELILLMGVAILLSAVISQMLNRLSTPLIQIALGVVIALLAVSPIDVALDPDFFMLLFIAPLLFHDAKKADKPALWSNKRTILSLAIGLVVAITLAVGFFVNWIIPSVPLAAAFALGAALGPTDAVAVTSLSDEAKLDRRENAVLQGEVLLNDASGVVAFQFAIAAAVTGAFSVVNASVSFLLSFVGGIGLGVLLALLLHYGEVKIRDMGLESTTFFVLYDVLSPFLIYLLAEVCKVSGILAVVAAGIGLGSFTERRIGPSVSRLNIVSSSVWRVLAFFINGLVFVLLGLQLPRAVQSSWDSVQIDNLMLIVWVLAITAIIVIVRFVWMLVVNRWSRMQHSECAPCTSKERLRTTLVTTLGGPKGAITLSIIFSIPFLLDDGSAFPQRDLLIFIASGVILCTLLLANFLLPVLAPDPQKGEQTPFEKYAPQRIEVMQAVIRMLNAESNDENSVATSAVIRSYQGRIKRIQSWSSLEDMPDKDLRIRAIRYQQDLANELVSTGEVEPGVARRYQQRLSRALGLLSHERAYRGFFHAVGRAVPMALSALYALVSGKRAGDADKMHELQIRCEKSAISRLECFFGGDEYSNDVIASVIAAYQSSLARIERGRMSATQAMTARDDDYADMRRKGLHFELDAIQEQYDEDRIPQSVAKIMRDNVNLMRMDLEDHL